MGITTSFEIDRKFRELERQVEQLQQRVEVLDRIVGGMITYPTPDRDDPADDAIVMPVPKKRAARKAR
jgi:hypothetical protein